MATRSPYDAITRRLVGVYGVDAVTSIESSPLELARAGLAAIEHHRLRGTTHRPSTIAISTEQPRYKPRPPPPLSPRSKGASPRARVRRLTARTNGTAPLPRLALPPAPAPAVAANAPVAAANDAKREREKPAEFTFANPRSSLSHKGGATFGVGREQSQAVLDAALSASRSPAISYIEPTSTLKTNGAVMFGVPPHLPRISHGDPSVAAFAVAEPRSSLSTKGGARWGGAPTVPRVPSPRARRGSLDPSACRSSLVPDDALAPPSTSRTRRASI